MSKQILFLFISAVVSSACSANIIEPWELNKIIPDIIDVVPKSIAQVS